MGGSLFSGTLASLLGQPNRGQLAFGAGMFPWPAIEAGLANRLITAPRLAAAVRPTPGIQAVWHRRRQWPTATSPQARRTDGPLSTHLSRTGADPRRS